MIALEQLLFLSRHFHMYTCMYNYRASFHHHFYQNRHQDLQPSKNTYKVHKNLYTLQASCQHKHKYSGRRIDLTDHSEDTAQGSGHNPESSYGVSQFPHQNTGPETAAAVQLDLLFPSLLQRAYNDLARPRFAADRSTTAVYPDDHCDNSTLVLGR